jgi:DNA-binding beta-propeller fold protein YncE
VANKVQKFTSNGTFITKWETPGTGDGQFQEPAGIAINSKGLVYVTDLGNSRVQVFAPS